MSIGQKGNRVDLQWNEATQQWRMSFTDTGDFIQEFFNCGNINLFFPELSKDKVNTYDVVIIKRPETYGTSGDPNS